MPIWTYDKPPTYFPNAVLTKKGWEDPDTGEVLVAIGDSLDAGKAAEANPVAVFFTAAAYVEGADVEAKVRWNEKVDVTNGSTIEVDNDSGGNLTLTAAEQLDAHEVLYVGGTAPAAGAVLSFVAQTITGTIVDEGTAVNTDKAITADQATAAGTRLTTS